MKKFLVASTYFLLVSIVPVMAQSLLDTASNYGGTWNNGSDQGTGFGPWSLSSTGTGGRYIGGSGLGANTFGIFGGTSGTSTAIRPFDASLLAGETFKVQLGYTGVSTGGEIGVNLWSGANWRLNLKFVGGQNSWQLSDGGSAFGSGLTWAGGSPGTTLLFEFTRGSTGNQYSLKLTQGSQVYNGVNNVSTSGVMSISRVEFYSNNQGNSENFGFNNLEIIPEPSSASLLTLALSGLLALRRRRNT